MPASGFAIPRRRPAPAFVAALILGCASAGPRPTPPIPGRVGTQLRLAAPDLEGREVDVGADQGKVRVIDFWATWCEPCRDAMPELDRLEKELSPRGLAVYGVSFDEDPGLIPAFLAGTPVGFRILWDRGGEMLAERFRVNRLPTTLVVDRRGVLRFVHEGWTPQRAREQRRQVEQLLAEP